MSAAYKAPRQLHSQHGLPIKTKHVLLGLILLRSINTFCTGKTFFQPDEYFQALEPAWNLAFGANSGAWLTWVGKRSLTHNRLANANADGQVGMEISLAFFAPPSSVCTRLYCDR